MSRIGAEERKRHGEDPFSDALVRSYLDQDGFVDRAWLIDAIHATLRDPSCRFVLVTGEPGSGKTALMAALAAQHTNALRYFIRRDSVVPLHSGDARSFFLAIGHQLAATQPEPTMPMGSSLSTRRTRTSSRNADALRHALEIVTGQRLTFEGENRAASDPILDAAVDVQQVRGYVAGIRARQMTTGTAHSAVRGGEVEKGGEFIGIDIDQIG